MNTPPTGIPTQWPRAAAQPEAMFTVGAFSKAEKPRSPRLTWALDSVLTIPFAPFRIVLPVKGVNLSLTGALVTLRRGHLDKFTASLGEAAREAALGPGCPVHLQIQHAFHHIPVPVLEAVFVREVARGDCHDIAVSFGESSREVEAILFALERQNGEDR